MKERFRFGIWRQLVHVSLGFLVAFTGGWLACYAALTLAGRNVSPVFAQEDPMLPLLLSMFIGSAVVALVWVCFIVYINRAQEPGRA